MIGLDLPQKVVPVMVIQGLQGVSRCVRFPSAMAYLIALAMHLTD